MYHKSAQRAFTQTQSVGLRPRTFSCKCLPDVVRLGRRMVKSMAVALHTVVDGLSQSGMGKSLKGCFPQIWEGGTKDEMLIFERLFNG